MNTNEERVDVIDLVEDSQYDDQIEQQMGDDQSDAEFYRGEADKLLLGATSWQEVTGSIEDIEVHCDRWKKEPKDKPTSKKYFILNGISEMDLLLEHATSLRGLYQSMNEVSLHGITVEEYETRWKSKAGDIVKFHGVDVYMNNTVRENYNRLNIHSNQQGLELDDEEMKSETGEGELTPEEDANKKSMIKKLAKYLETITPANLESRKKKGFDGAHVDTINLWTDLRDNLLIFYKKYSKLYNGDPKVLIEKLGLTVVLKKLNDIEDVLHTREHELEQPKRSRHTKPKKIANDSGGNVVDSRPSQPPALESDDSVVVPVPIPNRSSSSVPTRNRSPSLVTGSDEDDDTAPGLQPPSRPSSSASNNKRPISPVSTNQRNDEKRPRSAYQQTVSTQPRFNSPTSETQFIENGRGLMSDTSLHDEVSLLRNQLLKSDAKMRSLETRLHETQLHIKYLNTTIDILQTNPFVKLLLTQQRQIEQQQQRNLHTQTSTSQSNSHSTHQSTGKSKQTPYTLSYSPPSIHQGTGESQLPG
jgi:hypothetical protein